MERSDELRAVVQRYYDAMASGDHATIASLTCRHDGVLAIGTDPNEWWAGYEENVRVFEAQIADWHGGIPIVGGEIEAFIDGNVGWFADRPHLHLPDGSDVVMRLTGVLHREDGEWKFAQSHASIGIPNEDAVGRELSA